MDSATGRFHFCGKRVDVDHPSLAEELGSRSPHELRTAVEAFSKGEPARGDSRFALYDGIREAFKLILDDRPVALLLDDLHEANPREIDFLAYLARTMIAPGENPLLIVATQRPKANAEADAFASGEGLEVEVQEITVPIFPGKNITVIAETIAFNYLLRIDGYHAAQEFNRRLLRQMRPNR